MILSQAPVGFTWTDKKMFGIKVIKPRDCFFSVNLNKGVLLTMDTDFDSKSRWTLTYLPVGLV